MDRRDQHGNNYFTQLRNAFETHGCEEKDIANELPMKQNILTYA